jgi:uncharacterized membrane protein
MPTFKEAVENIGLVIDGAGVLAIIIGLVLATFRFVATGRQEANGYRRFRQDLGQGILLGLEFLVAADIIRTVAVRPTLESVLVLGLIVLIRTFLSMALQVELEGRWPWQQVDPTQHRTPAEGTPQPEGHNQKEKSSPHASS